MAVEEFAIHFGGFCKAFEEFFAPLRQLIFACFFLYTSSMAAKGVFASFSKVNEVFGRFKK
jgi:hypothetical protein